MTARSRRVVAAGVLATVASVAAGCASTLDTAAACDAPRRMGIVAQSVPSASYIPCVDALRPGWTTEQFDPDSDGTQFRLVSDRDRDHPVRVRLQASCDVGDATATTPRADGARTYLLLRSISPRYEGTLLDVFPGGCVTYAFDFARGPHIALLDDLQHQVRLVARREVALALRNRYGLELDR